MATLAHNLDVRRQLVWSCWGTGVTVGWIGDQAHQAECSDHNPDAAGIVHAIDVMVTGDRAQAVVNAALADNGDLEYIIYNRTIWSRSTNWAPHEYTGSDPHTNHVHLSGRHGGSHSSSATCTGYDTHAEATTPSFNICGGDMSATSDEKIIDWIDPRVEAFAVGSDTLKRGAGQGQEHWGVKTTKAVLSQTQSNGSGISELKTAVSALSAKMDEVLAAIAALPPAPAGDLQVSGTVSGTLRVEGGA